MSDRNDFFGFGRTETETEIRPPKPGRTETEIKHFEFDNKSRNLHSIFPYFYPHSNVKVHFHKITHRNQFFLIEIMISLNWTYIHKHSFDTGVLQYLHCTLPAIQSLLLFYTFKIPIGLISVENTLICAFKVKNMLSKSF